MIKPSLLLLASLAAVCSVNAAPLDSPKAPYTAAASQAQSDPVADAVLKLYQQKYSATTPDKPSFPLDLIKVPSQVGTMSSYDLERLSTYAGAAYKVGKTSWDCHLNCEVPSTNGTIVHYHWNTSGPDSYGYIASNPHSKEIFVAYRGSTTILDWVEDFTALQVPSPLGVPGSLMHVGFQLAYSAAAKEVKATVSKLLAQYPDYTLVLTGHSLGGAQAATAATDFAATHPEWIPRMKLVTFGQPRIGNIVHSLWLSSRGFPYFRVVNKGDIVPHVPFMWMNYVHGPQEVWYDMDGQTRFCGGIGENITCSDSVLPLQWSTTQHNEYPGLYFEPIYAKPF
ncbi:hypothetical protein GGI12_003716 [Dipsacomyces acuminosporus]|nr:hypothetical protein GGI12_003716 [Dipsacomyces acuminosporus]